MLFKNILDDKTAKLQDEFDRLVDAAYKNQSHSGDLLLIQVNGFYNAETHKWTNIEKKLSPYMIGPGTEGHCEYQHHKFIGKYINKGISSQTYDDYKNLHDWSEERAKEINEMAEQEADSIETEMMIYLKIWEGDAFIKKFYQLVRLSLGMEYDWHFSVGQSTRDTKATGTRDVIIRKKIRDRLKDKYPTIYAAIKNAYKGQVRNSIAHSKYSVFGRYIHLNNFIEEDPYSQIQVVSFDEWVDIMHDTLVIYTQQTRILNAIDEFYGIVSEKNDRLMEIRINKTDPAIRTEYHLLKHHPSPSRWNWLANEVDATTV